MLWHAACRITKQDIIDAVYQQTGRKLVEADLVIPEIKALGTFECSIKLVRSAQHIQGSMGLGACGGCFLGMHVQLVEVAIASSSLASQNQRIGPAFNAHVLAMFAAGQLCVPLRLPVTICLLLLLLLHVFPCLPVLMPTAPRGHRHLQCCHPEREADSAQEEVIVAV